MTAGSKNTKLRIGVIGVGHMGQYHVNVLSGLQNTHKLVGVYDTNPEHAARITNNYNVRIFPTLEGLFEKVDAVTIAVPTFLHFDIAKRALEHDCHVLVEKPITETVEQARTLLNLAREKKKILQVGHVERFNGAVMELAKIVSEPLLIEAKRSSPFTPRIKDVGVVLDMLIHDLDIVINLVDSPVKSHYAVGRSVMSNHEDIAIINLGFENGCMASIVGSRVCQHKERSLHITQDKSYIFLNYANQDIEIHRQASTAYLMTKEEIKYSQEAFVEKLYVHKDNPLKSEHLHFYNCIMNAATPFVDNEKDIKTLEIALSSIQQIDDQIRKGNESYKKIS